MDWNTASTEACRMWAEWVSARPAIGVYGYLDHSENMDDYRAYDLDYLHACILREARWHRTGNGGASAALISEVKGQLILLGKVRKALGKR